jgi:hypothetical protein
MHDFAQILSPSEDHWSDIGVTWAFSPTSKLRKVKKKNPKYKILSFFCLHRAPPFHMAEISTVIPYTLTYNKFHYFPRYINVFCLDSSSPEHKN